jgi:hypothetical protein
MRHLAAIISLCAATLASAILAAAQPYQGPAPAMMGGRPLPEIFIYSQAGLSGKARNLKGPVYNLQTVRFGGRARSASVVRGRWQLCTGIGYQGRCVTLVPGLYQHLYGTAGQIWSARPI